MPRRVLLILLSMVLLFSLAACSGSGDPAGTNNAGGNVPGNTQGNINNKGFVAFDGSRTFYSDLANQGFLTLRINGSSEEKILLESMVQYINIVGDYLFFSDPEDNYYPYCMEIDGGQVRRLAESAAYYITVLNGVVYFVDDSNYIRSMNLDGSDIKRLGNDTSRFFCVTDGLIFYHNAEENRVYKMNLDGSNAGKVSDEPLSEQSSYLTVTDQYIYFIDGDSHISRMGLDGRGKEVLRQEDNAACMNLSDGNIYYTSLNDGSLHRVNADGGDHLQLNQAPSHDINIVNGTVYFWTTR